MTLTGRLDVSRRVKIASGTTLATFGLLGSGLVVGSGPAAQGAEAPAPAPVVQKTAKDMGTAVGPAAKDTSATQRVACCWGAIHLSYQRDKVGLANQKRTKFRANRRAHRDCLSKTRFPCHKIMGRRAIHDSCGALAVRERRDGSVRKYGWSTGFQTKRGAKRRALNECRGSGRRCFVRAWVCTRR